CVVCCVTSRQLLEGLALRPSSTGGALYSVATARKPWNVPHTYFPTFTAWTTRVSNPVRSPCFRFSASVVAQRPAFAIGVPPDICAFHRYTRNSCLPYPTLVCPYPLHVRGCAPSVHCRRDKPPTSSLPPIIPDNARTLRITAAAGT